MTHFSSFSHPPAAFPRRHPLAALALLLAAAGAAQAQSPTVTRASLAPAANARAASSSTQVVVPFSQNIDPATAGNVRVLSQQYRGRRTATAAVVSDNTIQLTPTVPATGAQLADFKPGETVFVTVPNTVQSAGGVGAAPYVYQFTTGVSGGSGVFGPPAVAANGTVAVGAGPYSVVPGDVDGDGDLDLLTANNGGNSVSVRLNNGSGVFSPPAVAANGTVAVGANPYSVVLGDVDSDGDLDLLTSNTNANSVSVRLNNGSGVFGLPAVEANGTVAVGANPRIMTLGDVDGDGDLDLLTANFSSADVSVRFNNGSGVFGLPAVAANGSVAVGSGSIGVAVSDVDGDGDLDLLAANYNDNTVSVRFNNGSGVFSPPAVAAEGTVAVGTSPYNVAVGDVDSDGDLDLLSSGFVGGVSVRLNNGSGVFSPPAVAANGSVAVGSVPYSLVLGDVDSDNDLDLLTANLGENNVSVRLNNGNGVFGLPAVAANGSVAVGASSISVALGDVDGDGDLDLLTANLNVGTVSVRLNAPPVNAAPTALALSNSAVSENAGANATVGTFTTTDPNTGNTFTYSLVSGTGSTDNAGFNISGNTLRLTASADFETKSSYAIRVRTTDQGGLFFEQAFTITITDVAEPLTVSTGSAASPAAVPAGLYSTLTVTGTGVAQLTGAVQVTTAVAVQSGGTLLTNCQPLTGAGSFTLAAGATLGICDAAGISATTATGAVQVTGLRTFDADANYLYNGTVAQQTGPGLPASVRGLALNNAQGATLSSADLTATQALTLSSGLLTTGSYTITLGSGATLTEASTNYVLGTVQTTRPVSTAGSAQSFGGLGLTLTPDGSTLPGTTLVRRVTGTALGRQGINASIKRYYDIQPATNAGLNVTVQLGYLDTELNGIGEADLRVFRSSTGLSGPWEAIAVSSRDATANTLTATNVEHFSIWTLGSAANPLPVQLVAFTALPDGPAAVRLAWTTASEANSARFEVQRSADGVAFAAVGTVAAAGRSSSTRRYAYLDAAAPTGTSYYRLRQIDLDGTATYSPVRPVTLAGGPGALALYPNPAHGRATVSGLPAGTPVQVLDALGRPVLAARTDEAGLATLTLPAGLAPGVYVVRGGPQVARLLVE